MGMDMGMGMEIRKDVAATRTRTALGRLALLGSGAALAAVLAVGGAPMTATPALAQEATPATASTWQGYSPATVSVSGQGMVNVPPDTAQVTVGIDVIQDELAGAQAEATRQATAIIDALEAAGVESRDIQTANYSVSVLRDYSESGNPTNVTGFQVMNQVLVTIRDIDSVGALLDSVVSAGANAIYGVTFYVDDARPHESEARALAVEDATVRARELAEATGMELGRVVSISEDLGGYIPGPVYGRGGGMAEAAMDVPIETGTSQISVNVSVTFELDEAE
jgi:hypothetical protein